jgi:hypothetical protein
VGLALIRQNAEILVADSKRFAGSRSPSNADPHRCEASTGGASCLLGTIAIGSFPRELTLDGQTLLLTNYTTATLSLIDLSNLP